MVTYTAPMRLPRSVLAKSLDAGACSQTALMLPSTTSPTPSTVVRVIAAHENCAQRIDGMHPHPSDIARHA
ncbi:hypothetical protein PLICRDRAFT_39758 [Plicaturopsis crispa FD-325 SS-3]|nr:hypothetical protein PLICRDRAFT_39758 [Plicaturopsis crispa FD-325 SS-3]